MGQFNGCSKTGGGDMKKFILLLLVICFITQIATAESANFIPTMTSDTLPAGNSTIASTVYVGGYNAYKAFDHNNATDANGWLATTSTGYVQINLSAPYLLSRYVVYGIFQTGQENRAPRDWMLNASTNGITWITLDNQTNVAFDPVLTANKSSSVTTSTGYSYYRLVVTANKGGALLGVKEIEMHAATTSTTLTSTFTSNTTGGVTPISALFTDTSLGTPTTWNWTFREVTGNNTPIIFSTTQNPVKIFGEGNHAISLNVTNSTGAFVVSTQSTWINVTPYVASGFNRQDLVMIPRFTFTLNIVDSATSMPIPVVLVTDSAGHNQTTTTGVFTESYPYSSVIFYLTSTGYTGRTVSYIIDSDRTETVELSEAVEIPGVQPQAYPKYVTFHVKDGSMFGQPLAEVGINVTGISTSSGDWDWISQLIGVPLNEVPINTAHMYQTTDSLGRATFYVIPTAKYNITFTKVGYTISPMILVPQDDDYIVTATSATSPFYRKGVDEISAINITVSSTLYNSSHAFLNFTYYDSTGHTTGGTITVRQKSDTAWVGPTTMATWPVTGSSFTNSTVIVHIQQVSGYIDANITHSDFGNIVRSYPYSFNSVPVQFLGFGSDITLIVALGIMLFTMMLGGAAHGRNLIIIVSIEGWIMYTMHWFQSLFDRGVPEETFIAVITFMFIAGVLANVLMRIKRGL